MDHITAFGLTATARIAQSLGPDSAAVRLHANAEILLTEKGIRMFPDGEEVSAAALTRAAQRLGPDRFQVRANCRRDPHYRGRARVRRVGAECGLLGVTRATGVNVTRSVSGPWMKPRLRW